MDDLISRQVAIEKFEPWLKVDGYSEGELNMLKAVLYELRFLPSAQPDCSDCIKHGGDWDCDHVLCHKGGFAQPERMRGKWIWKGEEGDSRFMCSVCKCKEYVPTCNGVPNIWEFCPNCGADMRGEDDE